MLETDEMDPSTHSRIISKRTHHGAADFNTVVLILWFTIMIYVQKQKQKQSEQTVF
jgi:hypothetical protein